MTPRQKSDMRMLKGRVALLEQRNRVLSGAFPKANLDRLVWLLTEIETVCPHPHQRGRIAVSRGDARLLRPIVETLVDAKRRP